MRIQDCGPAFPQNHDGMTLRDYFAGQAMSGALASMVNDELPFFADWGDGTEDPINFVARHCYFIADAMLVARETNLDPKPE